MRKWPILGNPVSFSDPSGLSTVLGSGPWSSNAEAPANMSLGFVDRAAGGGPPPFGYTGSFMDYRNSQIAFGSEIAAEKERRQEIEEFIASLPKDVSEEVVNYMYSSYMQGNAIYFSSDAYEVFGNSNATYLGSDNNQVFREDNGVSYYTSMSYYMFDPQNGGGWDAANTTLNAFGFASGIKETIIEGGAALNRGINISKVNHVSILRTYGASGAKYLKISKGLGIVGSIVTTGYSVGQTINQYNTGGMNEVFNNRDVLDATVGMTGLGFAAYGIFVASNPIGWGVGVAVFLYGGATMFWDASHPNK